MVFVVRTGNIFPHSLGHDLPILGIRTMGTFRKSFLPDPPLPDLQFHISRMDALDEPNQHVHDYGLSDRIVHSVPLRYCSSRFVCHLYSPAADHAADSAANHAAARAAAHAADSAADSADHAADSADRAADSAD